jgi:hypothetical protein
MSLKAFEGSLLMAARAMSGSGAKRRGTGPFRQSPSKKSPVSGHSAKRVVTTVSLNSGLE